jgi:glycosyltransferase involved in cell wall biosynthesis
MLGWEFPPFITGGLGTACYGLTKAMERRGDRVTFVLPKHIDGQYASHVHLLSPGSNLPHPSLPPPEAVFRAHVERAVVNRATDLTADALRGASTPGDLGAAARDAGLRAVPLPMSASAPYSPAPGRSIARTLLESAAMRRLLRLPAWLSATTRTWLTHELAMMDALPEFSAEAAQPIQARAAHSADYGGNLIQESEQYARFCLQATRGLSFDVIHAHDWLTYPAGLAVARATGRPLVVHVHSTEFDRSGEHVNQPLYNIERRGMHGAVRVICVSMLTRNLVVNRYGVNPNKVDVVYNGVDLDPTSAGAEPIRRSDKIVLYFGRITMQKGPEYFISAAKRVLDVMDGVKFVVAGNGDQAQRMIEMAASMGIGNKVLFTGFLRGKDIPKVFAMADLYVMPSVSEPFGIAPLEALGHRVPVLISRTSGVSEILTNALKCDFWDIDDMANKIVAVLRHPPLQRTLRDSGFFEVRGITWDGAAAKVEAVYERAISAVH